MINTNNRKLNNLQLVFKLLIISYCFENVRFRFTYLDYFAIVVEETDKFKIF